MQVMIRIIKSWLTINRRSIKQRKWKSLKPMNNLINRLMSCFSVKPLIRHIPIEKNRNYLHYFLAQREDGFDSGEYTLTNPTTKVFRFGKKNLSCFTCNSIKDVDSCYKVDSQTNLVQCVHQNETFCKVS